MHTEKMKDELRDDFGIDVRRVTVIPFGINNDVPNKSLTRRSEQRLGIARARR